MKLRGEAEIGLCRKDGKRSKEEIGFGTDSPPLTEENNLFDNCFKKAVIFRNGREDAIWNTEKQLPSFQTQPYLG